MDVIGKNHRYLHTSASLMMLAWPAMEPLLQGLPPDLASLKDSKQDSSAIIMRIQEVAPKLPVDERLQEIPFVGMQSHATRASGAPRVVFPFLTRDMMVNLATAYFDTFNFLYPFMDRQSFFHNILSKVQSEGFDDDSCSILALLVFALGNLAIEGSRGNPLDVYREQPSGLRGGTLSKPPGLAFFNAAIKHIGFVLTKCDLENIQIFSLAAYVISFSLLLTQWGAAKLSIP